MRGGLEGLWVAVLLLAVLGGILALLTQIDGCDVGGGGCSQSQNTYDRSR